MTTSDAILFSANEKLVDMDDALRHLEGYGKLYWSIGFDIRKENFSFPIWGFIHISGERVKYRALISDIKPFSPAEYEDATVKPEAWREGWKNRPDERRPKKNTLVMTEIVPFEFDTLSFKKVDGTSVTHEPQGYVRVIPPNEPSESNVESQSPVLIKEKKLEDLIVLRPDAIEPGLRLLARQKSTPAGRLDLFCQDTHGNLVVVELKRARGTDEVVGQLLRYMGWAKEEHPQKNVRGIIVVEKIDATLRYALKAVSGIEAKEFQITIK